MNKLFKSIVAASVGVAMAIGVGAGLGREASAVYADGTEIADFSAKGYTNQQEISSYAGENFSIAFSKGTNSNAPKYYTSGTAIRAYGGNTITFSSTNTLTDIVWTFGSSDGSNAITTDVGDYSDGSWSGSASEVVFTIGGTSGNRRLQSVSVTYVGGSQQVDTYTVTYHDNDKDSGSTPTDNTRYQSGASVTVVGNTGNLARDGYVWSGWSTNQDGTGTAYGPTYTTTYVMGDDNVDFYPIWVAETPIPTYDGELAFHFAGSTVHGSNTGYDAREATVASQTTSYVNSSHWQITVGNNSAELGTNAKSGNLSKTTLGNGNFDAAEGLASALGITTSTQKYSAAICTSGMENIYEVELIYSGTNGGNMTTAWVLSSTNGTNWEIEATKTSSITSGSKFSFVKNDDSRQYAFVAYWNLTNSGGLKGFELKMYGEYPVEQPTVTITGLAASSNVFIGKTLDLGSTISVRATGGLSNAVTWVSDDEDVATVNELGVVTGVAEGTTDITVTSNVYPTATMTCAVTVSEAPMAYIINFGSAHNTNPTAITSDEEFKSTWSSNDYEGLTIGNLSKIYGVSNSQLKGGSNNATASISFTIPNNYFINSVVLVVEVAGGTSLNVISGAENAQTENQDISVDTLTFDDYLTAEESNHVLITSTANGAFYLSSITINYALKTHTPAEEIESLHTHSNLSLDRVYADSTTDVLDNEFTGVSGNYEEWNEKTSNSDAVYAGQSAAGDINSGVCIQLRSSNNNSGIVTTVSGGFAVVISVKWNSHTESGKMLEVYGKNDEAYSSATDLYGDDKGTLLGSIEYDNNKALVINSEYEYIGIRSHNGAVYLDSISITWSSDVEPLSYKNVAIRFSGVIHQDLWDELDGDSHAIKGFGMMFSSTVSELISAYNSALASAGNMAGAIQSIKDNASIRYFDNSEISGQVHDGAGTVATPDLSNGNYIWTLYKGVSTSNFSKPYHAVAFIKLENELIFLQEATASVQSLAGEELTRTSILDKQFSSLEQFNVSKIMAKEESLYEKAI